jgi:hypothetical protein
VILFSSGLRLLRNRCWISPERTRRRKDEARPHQCTYLGGKLLEMCIKEHFCWTFIGLCILTPAGRVVGDGRRLQERRARWATSALNVTELFFLIQKLFCEMIRKLKSSRRVCLATIMHSDFKRGTRQGLAQDPSRLWVHDSGMSN